LHPKLNEEKRARFLFFKRLFANDLGDTLLNSVATC
jgi:hypothetical protein